MATKTEHQQAAQTLAPARWLPIIISYLLIPLVLLVCGGDFSWWQAWVYSALIFANGVGGRMWADRRHPGLQAERQKAYIAQDVKLLDKVLSLLMAVSVSFPLYIVAGLDHRYRWSPSLPLWLNILGFILIAVGYTFSVWALVENRNYSSVMRIQEDRGHEVCDRGPYKIVRHPSYAGNMLSPLGIVLALDSLWTLIPVAVALVIAVVRTAVEDKTLQEELPGYKEYARQVRYKLFPGIY